MSNRVLIDQSLSHLLLRRGEWDAWGCSNVAGETACVVSWDFVWAVVLWSLVVWVAVVAVLGTIGLLKATVQSCCKRAYTAVFAEEEDAEDAQDDIDEEGGPDSTWVAACIKANPGLVLLARFFTQTVPSVYITVSFLLRMAGQHYLDDLIVLDLTAHLLFTLNLLLRILSFPLGSLAPMLQGSTIMDVLSLTSFALLLTVECKWPITDGSFRMGELCLPPDARGVLGQDFVYARTWFDLSFVRAMFLSELFGILADVAKLAQQYSRMAMSVVLGHGGSGQKPLQQGADEDDGALLATAATNEEEGTVWSRGAAVQLHRAGRRCQRLCPSTEGFCWQLSSFLLSTLAGLFVASVMVYVLEVVGEVPALRQASDENWLWKHYECEDGSVAHTSSDACSDEVMSPFTSFYFLLITISTVGYGDFSAVTVVARLFTLAVIILGVIAFGNAASSLLDLLQSRQRPWESAAFSPATMGEHVVVLGAPGTVCAAQLLELLGELYHEDHAHMQGTGGDLRTVVLCPESGISASLRRFLVTSEYSWYCYWTSRAWLERGLAEVERETEATRQVSGIDDSSISRHRVPFSGSGCVMYCQGSPLEERQLSRVAVGAAKAAFVISDATYPDASVADELALQMAMRCMQTWKQGGRQGEAAIRVLLRLPASVQHALSLGIPRTCIVCAAKFDMSLAALNAVVPGFAPALRNLLVATQPVMSNCYSPTQLEYAVGSGNEIYSVTLPEGRGFEGVLFSEAAAAVYFLSTHSRREGGVVSDRLSKRLEARVSREEQTSGLCAPCSRMWAPSDGTEEAMDALVNKYNHSCGVHLIGVEMPDGQISMAGAAGSSRLYAGQRVFGVAPNEAMFKHICIMDLRKWRDACPVPCTPRASRVAVALADLVSEGAEELTQEMAHEATESPTASVGQAQFRAIHRLRDHDQRALTALEVRQQLLRGRYLPSPAPATMPVRGGHILIMCPVAVDVPALQQLLQLLREPGHALSSRPILMLLQPGSDVGVSCFVEQSPLLIHEPPAPVCYQFGRAWDVRDIISAGALTAARVLVMSSTSAPADGARHGDVDTSVLLCTAALHKVLPSLTKASVLFTGEAGLSLLPAVLTLSGHSTPPTASPAASEARARHRRYLRTRGAALSTPLRRIWRHLRLAHAMEEEAEGTEGPLHAVTWQLLTSKQRAVATGLLASGTTISSGGTAALLVGSWFQPSLIPLVDTFLNNSSLSLQTLMLSPYMLAQCMELDQVPLGGHDELLYVPTYGAAHRVLCTQYGLTVLGIVRQAQRPGPAELLQHRVGHIKQRMRTGAQEEYAVAPPTLDGAPVPPPVPVDSEGGAPPSPGAASAPRQERALGGRTPSPHPCFLHPSLLEDLSSTQRDLPVPDRGIIIGPARDTLILPCDSILCLCSTQAAFLVAVSGLQRSFRRRRGASRSTPGGGGAQGGAAEEGSA